MSSHSVQEVADLAPLAHLIAIDAEAPVLHFFDGFRTSHEIQNIELVDEAEWEKLLPLDKVEKFKARALNPHTHPVTRGGAENEDIYFQGREAQNSHYAKVLEYAEKYFKEATRLTGRHYAPFTYYGDEQAEDIVIAMGSVTETTIEVIDELRKNGAKVGLVKVHLYRRSRPNTSSASFPTASSASPSWIAPRKSAPRRTPLSRCRDRSSPRRTRYRRLWRPLWLIEQGCSAPMLKPSMICLKANRSMIHYRHR
jgi:pyruvate-ferredoxin/flavodoxin oxidoreductase